MKTQKQMVTKEERATFALFSVVSNFAKADSTLAGRRIVTRVVNEAEPDAAPARTDGKEIVFNVANTPPVTKVDGLVAVNGLNYHELAHCLYTPRNGKAIQNILEDARQEWSRNTSKMAPGASTVHRAFNILEDNRIESIIIDQWPSTKPYLIATFAHYFAAQDVKTHDKAWPMCMGRSYLPKQVKSYFKQAFENSQWCKSNPNNYTEMQRVMREYKNLSAPNIHQWWREAYMLAIEYADLYPEISIPDDPFGNSLPNSGTFTGGGDPTEGGADGDMDGGDADDTDEESEGGDEGQGGDGAGYDPNSDDSGSFDTDPKQALNDVANQQANAPSVKQDVRRQQDSMRKGNDSNSALDKARSSTEDVQAPVKVNAQKFAKAMRRLVTDADPGFHKGHSSGRVNVQRAMRGEALDTVFDRWEEGRYDADSIELVVMLDRSGSMQGSMQPVCEAAWQIKHGAESISSNTRVTIIAFDDTSEILYSDNEKSNKLKYRSVASRGGTNPIMGLVETIRIMHNSDRKHKAVIILTDGSWWSPPSDFGAFKASAEEIIERLNVGGVTTACVLMGGAAQQVARMNEQDPKQAANYYDAMTHGAQVRAMVSGPDDFTAFSNTLVKRMIKN